MADFVQSPQNTIAVVIPTYNNGGTVADIATAARQMVSTVIVVNDGSTDSTAQCLAQTENIEIVTLPSNSGKGAALRAGFARARELGCSHAITVDADGQHLTSDIPGFCTAIVQEPDTLWIGNRVIPADNTPQPPRSRFGARVGAFWYRFHTGLRIHDTQCGFRAYPLRLIEALNRRTDKYEYELDLLIRAAWRKTAVQELPIHLKYLPPQHRVSHFRPVRDFLRIGGVNSKAALTRIFMPWRFIDAPGDTIREKLTNLVKEELHVHHDPARASFALALGVCIGLMPIHGLQVIAIIVLAFVLRLNKTLSFTGVTISSAPLIPFWIMLEYAIGRIIAPETAVIAAGRWLAAAGFERIVYGVVALAARFGSLLADTGIRSLGGWFSQEAHAVEAAVWLVQWVLGSILFSLAAGAATFFVCWPILKTINRTRSTAAQGSPR